MEEQPGTQIDCNDCRYTTQQGIDNNMDSHTNIKKWFQLQLAQLYRIEYFMVALLNPEGPIPILLGNTSDVDQGTLCTEIPISTSSRMMRYQQCEKDVTWIAKFVTLGRTPFYWFDLREMTIFGFET